MGSTTAERGTANIGTANRLSAPPPTYSDMPPLWSIEGQSAIPKALADALVTQLALDDSLVHGPVERLYPLAQRLIGTWEFLLDAATESRHDPRDRALLVTDALKIFAATQPVELVTISTGQTIPNTREPDEPALPVWAPSSFPPGMTKSQRERYPARPREVGEIPPFQPKNVRHWLSIVALGPQRSAPTPDAASTGFEPVPIVDEPARIPPNQQTLQNGLDKAMKAIEQQLSNARLSVAGAGKTHTVAGGVRLLSSLSLNDISQETKVTFKSPYTDSKLIELTEVIVYHSVFSVLLDKKGEPFNLNGRLDYPILVPRPGSQMQRNIPPAPGVYVSVQKYGDSNFRIGPGPIKKLLFGGVGGFVEYGYGHDGPHEFQTIIQQQLDFVGPSYIASIPVSSITKRDEITVSSLREKFPRLVAEALPFTVLEITHRLKSEIEDYEHFLASLGEELVRTLIYDQIRNAVKEYVLKKLGEKVLPLVNIAFAVYDALADADERMRIRHALAAVILALKGTADDDMTIAAKVLAKVMSDEFYNKIRQALINKGAHLAKRAATHLKPGKEPSHPSGGPPPAGEAPGPATENAAVDAADKLTHQEPAPKQQKPHDAVEPLSAREIAEVERLQAARAKQKTDEQTRKTDDKKTGSRGTDDPHAEGSEGTEPWPGIMRIGESRIEGETAGEAPGPATSAASTATGNTGTPSRRSKLVEPGKPAVPPSLGGAHEFQTPIGPPEPHTIGGAHVVSRRPDVLVGAKKTHFREDVAAVIFADPHHPLRKMLDPHSVASGNPAFVTPWYGPRGQRDTEWRRHPEDWQAGHARTGYLKDADVLVLQTRYQNQLQNNLHESGQRGEVTMDKVLVIGNIAVEYHSAWDLWHADYVDLSYDEMSALPELAL